MDDVPARPNRRSEPEKSDPSVTPESLPLSDALTGPFLIDDRDHVRYGQPEQPAPESKPPSERSEDYPATREEKRESLDRMARNLRFLKSGGHLRMRPEISRERARELATDAAAGRDVYDVVDPSELTAKGIRAPCVYGVDFSGCWIAYLVERDPLVLQASDIVVIEKATGTVRYIGSADDEG